MVIFASTQGEPRMCACKKARPAPHRGVQGDETPFRDHVQINGLVRIAADDALRLRGLRVLPAATT